jgi:signal transduction histidine kinase
VLALSSIARGNRLLRFGRIPAISSSRLPFGVGLFAAAVIGLLWAFTLVEGWDDVDRTVDQAKRDTASFALAYREHISQTIASIDQLMLVVEKEFAADPDGYHLPEWLATSPFLQGLTVLITRIGANGFAIESTLGPDPNHTDVRDRPHFIYHLTPGAPQPYISAPVVGRLSGKESVQITRRLERRDGSMGGVLVTSVDPAALSRFFEAGDLGDQGVVVLVGLDGVVRARRTKYDDSIGQDLRLGAVFQRTLVEPSGSLVTHGSVDGIERIYSFQRVPGYPLIVIVGRGVGEVLAIAHAEQWRRAAVAAALSAVLIALATLLLRELWRRRRLEEARYDQVIESMPQAFALFDEKGRIVSHNRHYLELRFAAAPSGEDSTSLSSLKGMTHREVIAMRHRAALRGLTGEEAKRYLDDRAAVFETSVRNGLAHLPDGRWMQVNRLPVTGGGTILAWTDVTALKVAEDARQALEQQLHHNQKLEALGTLAGGIAHDLNNTLMPILALSAMALDEPDLSEDWRKQFGTMRDCALRARDLVRRILGFARKDPPQQHNVDVAVVIEEAIGMLRASIPATIRFEAKIAPVPLIKGDAGQLNQVLVNLIANAAHAIGERQGCITVELAHEPGAEGAGELRLAVHDDGTGIDEATISRIFEPFFTTKNVGEGTGLGLSIAHGIITNHHGRIEVHSKLGAGTVFVVHLPVAPDDVAPKVEQAA